MNPTKSKAHRLASLALLWCGACVHTGTPPVPACPIGPDGAHPSTGVLQVLPSEVPDVALDSMRWQTHTGHEGEEFGTWTSLRFTGRIVSTKLVSLVGVGVLVEGLRDSVVVHRMIDSTFFEWRDLPATTQFGTAIILERVRPDRPVPVHYLEKYLGSTPLTSWGCPTRARIIRLSPDNVARRAPSVPDDELQASDFYQWDPRTFDVDSALANGWGAFALLEGPAGGTARTDFVIVRTKILYRTMEHGRVRTDSARIAGTDFKRLFDARDSVVRRAPRATRANDDPRIAPPSTGESVVVQRTGWRLMEVRFPTHAPPPEVGPLLAVLSEMRARAAQRALTAP